MRNTCPVSGCDAVYNLNPQHVGRQFACRKCGTPLFVDSDGLRRADATGVAPAAPAAAPAVVRPPQPVVASPIEPEAPVPPTPATPFAEAPASTPSPTPGYVSSPIAPRKPGAVAGPFRGLIDSLRHDVASWAFGIGALLVILFLFLPVIDVTKVGRMKAQVESIGLREARAAEEYAKKRTPSEAERKARDSEKEAAEAQRKSIEQGLLDHDLSTRLWRYWYAWGMLAGFVMLAFGAIGYLRPQQAMVRRIVGAVVICGQLLLIFLAYVNGSMALMMGPK